MSDSRLPEMQTAPELLALLDSVKKLPPPTPIQLADQRRSWVRGEMLMGGKLSEAEVDALLDNIPEFALLSRVRELEAENERLKGIEKIVNVWRSSSLNALEAMRQISAVVPAIALSAEKEDGK